MKSFIYVCAFGLPCTRHNTLQFTRHSPDKDTNVNITLKSCGNNSSSGQTSHKGCYEERNDTEGVANDCTLVRVEDRRQFYVGDRGTSTVHIVHLVSCKEMQGM